MTTSIDTKGPWNIRAADLGPNENDRKCTCCSRVLDGAVRMLELDQRTGTYHDFGGVPTDQSQGWFPFGLACSRKQRKNAADAMATPPRPRKITGRAALRVDDVTRPE